MCGTCIVLIVRASFGQPSHDLTNVTQWQFDGFGTKVTHVFYRHVDVHLVMLQVVHEAYTRFTEDSVTTQSQWDPNTDNTEVEIKVGHLEFMSIFYTPQYGCALFCQLMS